MDSNSQEVEVNVTASAPTCTWTATTGAGFVGITSGTSGTGSGTASLAISANGTGAARSGTLDIAGQAVTVSQAFTAESFIDVPPSAYYFDAVNLLKGKNITAGCTATTYCPSQDITRSQMAVFIVRSMMGGDNFTASQTPYFTDVPVGAFGFKWIQKLYELGVTTGCGQSLYCPNDNTTRAQMAIFLIRMRYGATAMVDNPIAPYFTDVPPGAFGFDWIQRLREDNITSGCAATLYCPTNPVIRGDMAIFVMRGGFNQLLPPTEPIITQAIPTTFTLGQLAALSVTGVNTNFVQGTTVVNTIPGFTVGAITVTSPTTLMVNLTAGNAPTPQPESVWITTGPEEAVLPNVLQIAATFPVMITDFNPKSGPIGTLISVTGANLVSSSGAPAAVTLAGVGGSTISAPVSTATATGLSFVIPAGAATGPLTFSSNNTTAVSSSPLTVTAPNNFTMTALPGSATLIPGPNRFVSYSVQLGSVNGFSQLATLAIAGVPAGVNATFKPPSITAGQTSVLTLSAPAGQAIGTATLSITSSAVVGTVPVQQTVGVVLEIAAPSTSFLARSVVSDSLETPLGGVTVKMLGTDGNEHATSCSGTGISDTAGNIFIANLPDLCTGPQLIGFDGTTATNPAGHYAGVNIVYTFASGQPTASPVLVHLPRIDNAETFMVQQNATTDQTYAYASIPGLKVTVYANTTLTLADQTTPNPFPLTAVQVPVDRLPDNKPNVPTMMRVFIVAFQPANATASQPVAVFFPNTINTPPGTSMALMTLDPTHGQMVPYGTGIVSVDGTQIVPDEDPEHVPHLYGLKHFDWHGPMPPPPPTTNPSAAGGGTGNGSGGTCGGGGGGCSCTSIPCVGQNPQTGEPIDLASGLYVSNVTDMTLSSARGTVAIQRIYRTLSTNDGPFGIGSGAIFNYSLDVAAVSTAQVINLINPDQSRFPFTRQIDGTLINLTVPFSQGAVITTTPDDHATLRYKNGTSMVFQRFGSVSVEVSQSDSNGNTITITRNAGNPLEILSISDPIGRQLTFTPDSANASHIASIADPIGRTVRYTYNPSGTLASVTDPAGGLTQYFYDSGNRLASVVDPRQTTVLQNVFDVDGRVIQQTQADNGVTTISYELGNPMSSTSYVMDVVVTDPLKKTNYYRFNPQGFVITAIDALGQTTVFNRDPQTNLVLSSVGNANCPICGPTQSGDFTFTYDSSGNMASRTDNLGNKTGFTYDPVFSKVTSITDPLGFVTQFFYDSHGNLTKTIDADLNANTYAYDSTGLLTQATDALMKTTVFGYDFMADLTTVQDPLGNVTSYAYDGISRRILTVDALNRRTTFAYDALNRLTQQTDAMGGVTLFDYDGNSNLSSVTDANTHQTAFTYDLMNRLATRTNPLHQTDTRSYDADGNLTQFVDRRGLTSTYTYDGLNRLTGETYQDATVARSYDARSRLTMVTDTAAGDFSFAYDLDGSLTGSTTPFGSIGYTYDPRQHMASRQVQGQSLLAYAYDPVGNLTSAAMPQVSAGFTYTPRNQPWTLTRANGITSSSTYDDDARLLNISHALGASLIDAESYGYDAIGNRISHVSSIAQALTTQPTANQFNANNEMTQFGALPNTFDANGNLTQDGSATYTWDGRNRLRSIVTNAVQTTLFTYDFTGQMLQQADTGTSLNLTKSFVLDDLTDMAYESASDGTSYSVLAGRSIDSHLATQSGSQGQYALTDAVNSTIATADQTGAVQSKFTYEPFGQATASGSYPFEFTGRVPVSSSLYYYRARFYNTQTGRFISEDPIGFAGGPNLYSYVSNNPTNLADPTGLLQKWDFNDYCSNICGPLMTGACLLGCETPIGIAACGLIMSGPGCTQYCKELDRYSKPWPKRNPPTAPPTYITTPPAPSTGAINIYTGPLTPGTNTYPVIQ